MRGHYGSNSGIGSGKWTCDRHGALFCRECLRSDAVALGMETQKREQFEEEVWCAHRWLDEKGVPRDDWQGNTYSLVGRMIRLADDARTGGWNAAMGGTASASGGVTISSGASVKPLP